MRPIKIKVLLILSAICILYFLFLTGYMIYTQVIIPRRIVQERRSLHSIATALESYYIDWSEYPHELEVLTKAPNLKIENGELKKTGTFLIAVPRSAFGTHPFPRYFRGRTQGWFVWLPGPDEDFDISLDENLKSAFDLFWEKRDREKHTISSPWLADRLYDPTNGLRSNGDILRTQFQ